MRSATRTLAHFALGIVCNLSARTAIAQSGSTSSPASVASFRGSATHSGAYVGGGTLIVGMQWRFLTNGDVISSPTIVGNTVFIGSGDGNLYAIDLVKGTKLWSFDAGGPIASSPAIANGLALFGTYDGRFFAVDAKSGAPRWKMSTGSTLPFPWGHESGDRYTSSPTVVAGTAVFGAGDGYVYAVDAQTGKTRWRAKTEGRVRGSPAVSDGAVFVGSFDGRVYSFDLGTGKERWHYDTEGASLKSDNYGFDRRSIQSSPAVVNGIVYVGARDGFVYALAATDGALKWKYDHKISWINSSPAVVDGVVYDGSSDAHFVQALDATTGKELWRADVGGAIVWSSPAVTAKQLFVGDGAGRLLALDRASGKILSTFRTGSAVFSSPAVAGHLVVFGSNDGGVYALRVDDTAPVQRAVFIDSSYVRAGVVGRSTDIAASLSHRGYTILDPTSLGDFLHARTADKQPSVIVFATEHLPPSITSGAPQSSPLRAYLNAGGKVVWSGVPPMLWVLNAKGEPPGLDGFQWDAPTQLLGVDHQAGIFDERSVHANDEGLRWGLPRAWRSGWGVAPSGVTHVLAADEWGLAAGWVKNYGGAPGTGFVRVADDPLAIYLAAEYRPTP